MDKQAHNYGLNFHILLTKSFEQTNILFRRSSLGRSSLFTAVDHSTGSVSPSRHLILDRLVGFVVKAAASVAEDPGFESRLRRYFSGSSYTSDLKIGSPVATLPGAWHYRVSAVTGWPGVSIL